jgi:phosphatidylglycerol:prolipoprotein diacylglycerol transferase
LFRIKKGEFRIRSVDEDQKNSNEEKSSQKELILSLLLVAFIGLLVGGRAGYVLFYNFSYYWTHPIEIISPFDSFGNFVGIYGMSFHGGFIGAVLAGVFFAKKNNLDFLQLADFIVPAIPAGYFFGRIGNFMNNELFGRVTLKPWGMYFSNDPAFSLRHPSQLYEAFSEGLVLFLILWIIRNKITSRGEILFYYVVGYSVFRIICEFFREPDAQIGYYFGYFTLGQFLSLGVILIAAGMLFKKRKSLV